MNKGLSNVTKEQADWNFCRLGDAQQGFDGNYFFTALNFADVFGIQIGPFSQLFLRETGALAIKTNGFADDFPVPQDRLALFILRICHSLKARRGKAVDYTSNMLVFLRLDLNRGKSKKDSSMNQKSNMAGPFARGAFHSLTPLALLTIFLKDQPVFTVLSPAHHSHALQTNNTE
jgi:hypothetical protein